MTHAQLLQRVSKGSEPAFKKLERLVREVGFLASAERDALVGCLLNDDDYNWKEILAVLVELLPRNKDAVIFWNSLHIRTFQLSYDSIYPEVARIRDEITLELLKNDPELVVLGEILMGHVTA